MAKLDDSAVYLGAESVSKYLSEEWKNLVEAVENVLKSYSAGNMVQPVRLSVPVEKHEGMLHAMPAYNKEDDTLATKIVNLFPQNKKKGLPAVCSTVLLYDATNGRLKAILDGDLITDMRTAAASLVATKYLANKHDVLAILGSGVQARSHYKGFCHFYNFQKIFIWNHNKETAIILAREMEHEGLQCEVCNDVENAVKDADIIITVTWAKEPILRKEWVKAGAHINAIGATNPNSQELENDLLLSSVVYVDSRDGALEESGDIVKSKAPIYAEIGEVASGLKEAFPEKTTIFVSLGMAAEDVAAAELIYKNYMSENKN